MITCFIQKIQARREVKTMARQKHTLIWPCTGGNKRVNVIGKPGFTYGGVYATFAAAISAPFATTPGSDGTAVSKINRVDVEDGVTDSSTTKPLKGVAMVSSFVDEDGDYHKYRFPEPLAANMTDDDQGNTVLTAAAGAVLGTELSNLSGYTMTFVRGWLDRSYQQS